jgi:hypothetical protein
LPSPPGPGAGVVDPFRPPAPEATQLNADAKVVYRQGKWDDARAKYRAAEAADPEFLAPRLNIACSFVRQERFDEAVAEVRGLLDRAYMPWSREVLEAADLGALKVQPQMAEVKHALAKAAEAWGAGLEDAVIFVGRLREPLHMPPGKAGTFILNPHQEVFAYLPETGRFRQLTAEDGHVLMVVRSPDRRRIVYFTAQKLIRGDKDALDGVAVRELTLATMSLSPPVLLPGPMVDMLVHRTPQGFLLELEGVDGKRSFLLVSGARVPPQPTSRTPVVAWLRPFEVSFVWPMSIGGGCGVSAGDRDSLGHPMRVIEVKSHGRSRTVGEPFGAGLAGIPLPR